MTSSLSKRIKHLIDIDQIEVNKEYSKLSKLHKYWARKPWYVLDKYIEKYSKSKEVILDPFCGSGSMGLEAIVLGRNFIGYDLNPFACFLTECTLENNFDKDLYDNEFKLLSDKLKNNIMKMYDIGNESFVLYHIKGLKNIKNYNCVTSDYNFEKKQKITLSEKKSTLYKIPSKFYYPDKPFPKKFYKDRFSYKGVKNVSDMFSRRNLYALSLIYTELENHNLKYRNLFFLALTNTLLHVSKLKSEDVRPLGVNNYWIPDNFIEENVWWRFEDRARNIKIAKTAVSNRIHELKNNKKLGKFTITNNSATKMNKIKNNSINYVITDPPYGDAIQYSELSYIWNCWLQKDFKIEDEIIINPVQNKGINEFSKQIEEFIMEIKRVLKNNAYFTLCFQNKDISIWLKLADIIKRNNFQLVDVSAYDTLGTPFNKNWSQFSPKSDFYVTFRKRSKLIDGKSKNLIIDPEKIINNIVSHYKLDKKLFNLNKAYDLFVSEFISELFSGKNIELHQTKNLNLKNIIIMFENELNYGNKQTKIF